MEGANESKYFYDEAWFAYFRTKYGIYHNALIDIQQVCASDLPANDRLQIIMSRVVTASVQAALKGDAALRKVKRANRLRTKT